MAKQMTDDVLRQQIAQWTRAALGHLVEDDKGWGALSQAVAAPIVMRYSRGRGVDRRVIGTQLRKKELKAIPATTLARLATLSRDARK